MAISYQSLSVSSHHQMVPEAIFASSIFCMMNLWKSAKSNFIEETSYHRAHRIFETARTNSNARLFDFSDPGELDFD